MRKLASGTGDANRPNRVLVRFAADGILAVGKPQRLPVGLADADGLLLIDTPATFTAQIVTEDGKPVGAPLTVDRHAQDLPRPYYPFIMNITEPGTYSLVGTVDGVQVNTAFSILDASKVLDPAAWATRWCRSSRRLPPTRTASRRSARASPRATFIDVTLTDALKAAKPVAFLIATPAYCQTAACGPVLDVLLGQQSEFGDKVQMVHAEVYTDSSLTNTTPAVQDYHLTFEPVLYLAGADGVDPDAARLHLRRERATRRAAHAGQLNGGLAERLAAAAGAGGVRVVDREPGALQAVLVVERGARQQLRARRVDDDLHAAELGQLVVAGDVGVEEHLVREARAATGAHGDAQRQLGLALGVEQLA